MSRYVIVAGKKIELAFTPLKAGDKYMTTGTISEDSPKAKKIALTKVNST